MNDELGTLNWKLGTQNSKSETSNVKREKDCPLLEKTRCDSVSSVVKKQEKNTRLKIKKKIQLPKAMQNDFTFFLL